MVEVADGELLKSHENRVLNARSLKFGLSLRHGLNLLGKHRSRTI